MVAAKCVVMYGGGLTSYEASRRAIEIYGKKTLRFGLQIPKQKTPTCIDSMTMLSAC
jgi:hypothetical protein